jgi:hypothetical protein
MSERNKPGPGQMQMGDWIFEVIQGRAYLHHVKYPGDISVQAKPLTFAIEVSNDNVDTLKAKLEVPYADLGPKMP